MPILIISKCQNSSVSKMKVYTKKGDSGETSLLGGARVPKHHLRIEAYGTVDELNSQIGLLKADPEMKGHVERLTSVQNELFTIGSHMAVDPSSKNVKLPALNADRITEMEAWIDEMEEVLPMLKSFVLPGGSRAASQCHVVRCVCRRAERRVSVLQDDAELDAVILPYLNRLSDYLFVLSRKVLNEQGLEDEPWVTR